MTNQKRNLELDILRCLALLAVISMHVHVTARSRVDELLCSLEFAAVTWCVPVYVMISGRLFLAQEKEMPISRYFTKYIARIAVAFVFWSAVYQGMFCLLGAYEGLNWKGIFAEFVNGPYHMWFLWMICGLYLLTPVLRRIAGDPKTAWYFAALFLGYSILDSYGTQIPLAGVFVETALQNLALPVLTGMAGYYVLGHAIHDTRFTQKQERLIYAVGIAAFVFTCGAVTVQTVLTGESSEFFVKYERPNVMLTAGALFTYFDKRVSRCTFRPVTGKLLNLAAGLSFGMYLCHGVVAQLLYGLGELPWLPGCLARPAAAVLVFAVSALLTMVLRKIPVVGKWIT